MDAVQSEIRNIRDSIQQGFKRRTVYSRRLGFAVEDDDSSETSPFHDPELDNLLGYAPEKRKMSANNPSPASTTDSTVLASVWTQGFGDRESRTGSYAGIDIGRRQLTGGGNAGADFTFTNVGGKEGFFVMGALASGMTSSVHNNDGSTARIDGPGIGVYLIYINGGFSTDLTWKDDFLTEGSTTLVSSLRLNNMLTAWNISYKVESGKWWFEPTAGVSNTQTLWGDTARALLFVNGNSWRVQGGIRSGTSYDAGGGIKIEPTFSANLYEDVSVRGGTLSQALTPQAPNDAGKIFGQGIAKLNADFGQGLSTYVEAEVRGRESVFAIAARVGLRKTFQ
jgi:outer membrane autotransporter protein